MTFVVSLPYRLKIPPDPDLLTTARMFASAVADQTDFDEVVDDIKVAITEGVSLFIGEDPTTRPIMLEVSTEVDHLRFTITGEGPIPDGDDMVSEPRTGMDLVRALFPSLSLVRDPDGRTRVSFDVARADRRV